MINEYFLCQIGLLIIIFYFSNTINVLTLWYIGGIYLFLLGFLLLLDDGDIFVGFLWIIDLGVGLIFFIFILHFSNFLHQKSYLHVYANSFFNLILFIISVLVFFFFISFTTSNNNLVSFSNSWWFFISWYDYYDLFYWRTITDLNILREIYFSHNSFEFFLINFMVLYGILAAIILTFLIKKIFSIASSSQLKNFNLLAQSNSTFFIRNQNFIKQQNMSTGTRVWIKKKHIKL